MAVFQLKSKSNFRCFKTIHKRFYQIFTVEYNLVLRGFRTWIPIDIGNCFVYFRIFMRINCRLTSNYFRASSMRHLIEHDTRAMIEQRLTSDFTYARLHFTTWLPIHDGVIITTRTSALKRQLTRSLASLSLSAIVGFRYLDKPCT